MVLFIAVSPLLANLIIKELIKELDDYMQHFHHVFTTGKHLIFSGVFG